MKALVTGPINKMRWIYSCSKQMMDRLIFAYGQEEGLRFTLFRPFNWVGPRLDTFRDAEENKARSVTQMIYNVLHRGKISLVNGGRQRRSFTWVGDGIEGLVSIIENKDNKADGQIFNIGNPGNNHSIRELAEMLIEEMKNFPAYRERAENTVLEEISADDYYGKTCDDMQNRLPSVKKMEKLLGWKPRTGMRELLSKTVAWYAAKEDGLTQLAVKVDIDSLRDTAKASQKCSTLQKTWDQSIDILLFWTGQFRKGDKKDIQERASSQNDEDEGSVDIRHQNPAVRDTAPGADDSPLRPGHSGPGRRRGT